MATANSKIKSTYIDENGINGSQSLSPRRTPVVESSGRVASVGKSKVVVESCVAGVSKSKAVGGKSKARV